jgi:hypothetical protein
MFPLPVHRLIDAHLQNPLGEAVSDGDGEPLPTISGFDPVAILKFVFFVLDGVQQTEDIAAIKLVKIAQPGEILGLMDGYRCHEKVNSSII